MKKIQTKSTNYKVQIPNNRSHAMIEVDLFPLPLGNFMQKIQLHPCYTKKGRKQSIITYSGNLKNTRWEGLTLVEWITRNEKVYQWRYGQYWSCNPPMGGLVWKMKMFLPSSYIYLSSINLVSRVIIH
jgi:hypothetical protein